MSLDVLGLGAVAMDVVLNCQTLPGEDGYAVIDSEMVTPGGSCANLLVVLAGLGTKTGLAAQLGNDEIGRKLKQDLEDNGVSTRYVAIKKDGVSMHTYVAVDRRGVKTIFCNMGTSLLSLDEKDIGEEMLDGVKVLYTDLQPGRPALKLARLGRQREIPVIYNLQVDPSFLKRCGISRLEVEEMLSLSRIIVTFRQGLIHYTGERDITIGARSVYEAHRPPAGIIVTLGQDGALWYDGKELLTVPAFQVDCIDTTGAGDAFLGGFIQALFFEKYSRKNALTFANACAAMKCLRPGPRLKVTKDQVLGFIQGQGRE